MSVKMKHPVLPLALLLATVPLAMGQANAGASQVVDARPDRSPDPALQRAVAKICRKAPTCPSRTPPGEVRVWRNKQGKVRLLEYYGMGCNHASISYYDPKGKFLVAQTPGPREPEDWNSPDDQKIRKLRAGLTEAEYYDCSERTPRYRD
jgi:hypothetical protein